jgi:predicted TIM-barrel fold metal-dependent hydrolase
MMIDIHTHLGKILLGRKPLTAKILLKTMDKLGIEKSVVLPIENPEETHWYFLTRDVIKICRRYPDRLTPFCNVDPRRGVPGDDIDFYPLVKEYVEKGCKGFGEVLAALPLNYLRLKKIYKICGEFKIPVLIHIGREGGIDKRGLPYLEEMLKEFPQTNFIGHASYFWAEISKEAPNRRRESYPKGKVRAGGKLDYLFDKYSNLYGDLSAGSGYNALARDIEFAKGFLERNKSRLLFGTDYLYKGQDLPIVDFLRNLEMSRETFKAITHKNAKKLLRI